jgi:hypothetical protein
VIELHEDSLVFAFPEVHPRAKLTVEFQRTLRIPDDDRAYPLPPGLGEFPLRHVDDFGERVPPVWLAHGGILLPMYQSEALWLSFQCEYLDEHETDYPFAIKVATGKIDAVSGQDWSNGLHRRPQDYMVAPEQPWLDGYCVEKGLIRQFVAMPLGAGYTAEEQVTGKAEHGGLQIIAYPMRRKVFERRFPKVVRDRRARRSDSDSSMVCCDAYAPGEMGLAPGGRMKQEIYEDPYKLADWDTDHRSRCFVHIANSLVWRAITGEQPPTTPPTAREYTDHGLPWFEYYAEGASALEGSSTLGGLKSVHQLGQEKGDVPLPENESATPDELVQLRKGLGKDQVREGGW